MIRHFSYSFVKLIGNKKKYDGISMHFYYLFPGEKILKLL